MRLSSCTRLLVRINKLDCRSGRTADHLTLGEIGILALPMGESVKQYLDGAAALFALLAGILWIYSANVDLPKQFRIDVKIPRGLSAQLLSGPVGTGKSEDIEELGRALSWQSKLSAWAAYCAAFAALCQTLSWGT